MSMNAVAIVKIAPETLTAALRPSGGGDLPDVFDRGGGLAFRLRALDDATLIVTSLGFDREPDEIAEALKRCLGGVLSAHRDSHGVLVFPDKAMPSAGGYDAAVVTGAQNLADAEPHFATYDAVLVELPRLDASLTALATAAAGR
ncbi:MAG: hypothetical protein WCJ30_12440 [Deltaproteobacteria bacterium]